MTRIVQLEAASLTIPFKVVFKHASAVRSRTATVWVQASSSDGMVGYGEGCPREYVTGESVGGALDFIHQVRPLVLSRISDLASLSTWVQDHTERINANPAAWCATEMAVLDLLARQSGQSIEALLGVTDSAGVYQYSAVLGDASETAFSRQLDQYVTAGFVDFKLKVTGDLHRDRARVDAVTEAIGREVRIRLDANNLWRSPDEAISYLREMGVPLLAIEEPLAAGDYQGAGAVSEALGVPIILDEGFLRIDQLPELASHPERWILNLRVSKLGGILRSLAIVKAARQAGLRIIMGAQVGETSLLTRAALTLASQSGDMLVAQEGAFGTQLLEADVCDHPLMFGPGGQLRVGEHFAGKAGMGLEVEASRISRWCVPEDKGTV